jgi:hypothetical protein
LTELRRPRNTIPGLLLFAILAPAIVWTQQAVDARTGRFRAQEEVLYLWSGRHVKRLAPGFEGLLADLYWLRTVQYFGGKRVFSQDRDFDLLEPLTEITVTLDPRLEIAYRYGAVFLAEPQPIGAGRPHSAVALLERGCRENPDNWRLRKELAYFHFLFLHDTQTAARILLEAAELPGAAYWLRTMAADLVARGGDRATSRRIWEQVFADAEDGAIKENARVHLNVLDALDQRDALQAAAAEFDRRAGRRPSSLHELARLVGLPAPLEDPSGVPFDYDASTGTVAVSRTSILWRPDR